MAELGIRYGAICDPIDDQIKAQGYKLPEGKYYYFQDAADAITRLLLAGYITDGEADKARRRLHKKITSVVEAA